MHCECGRSGRSPDLNGVIGSETKNGCPHNRDTRGPPATCASCWVWSHFHTGPPASQNACIFQLHPLPQDGSQCVEKSPNMDTSAPTAPSISSRNDTPAEWHNVHFSDSDQNVYYSLVSNLANGVTFARSADGHRAGLTPETSRTVYLRDADTGEVWSIAGYPVKTAVENYRCVYTLHDTTITSVCLIFLYFLIRSCFSVQRV